MIPKVIHYTWFGGKPLPREVRSCIDSWRTCCPDYEIVRWDEDSFDVDCHPFCRAAYANQKWAFVSDYARLKIIYEHGGIYLDTDVRLLRNLDGLLDSECWLGIEQSNKLCATGLGFGAVAQNETILKLMSEYDHVVFSTEKLSEIACPILNTRALQRMGYLYCDDVVDLGDALIFPPKFFDPIAPGSSTKNLMCSDTYSIHQYSNSWGSKNDVLRRKIIRVIGVDRVDRIKTMIGRMSHRNHDNGPSFDGGLY